ncbi:MinD/ParA family ATP-binding protein [Phycicoccus avicenniae]|uniref:MinD/ParA family ATP-binding protein n=1 Tax=Phycicoccus avicenniae TaxID=2828860 RepID=UPI003D290732
MVTIALCSAAGSPGVTSTALGLAMTWARPVLLVEADPTGGSAVMAGHFRGQVHPAGSLVDLAMAHRSEELVDAIPAVAMTIPGSGVSLLTGTRSHGQARALAGLWEPLSAALARLNDFGQDVILDVGRLGLSGSPERLLYGADVCLLVLRTDLVALAAARSWAETLSEGFESVGHGQGLFVVTVGEGRPYSSREIAKVLGLPVVASVAWDEVAAAVFARGEPRPRRLATSAYVRSLGRLGETLRERAHAARGGLDGDRQPVAMPDALPRVEGLA